MQGKGRRGGGGGDDREFVLLRLRFGAARRRAGGLLLFAALAVLCVRLPLLSRGRVGGSGSRLCRDVGSELVVVWLLRPLGVDVRLDAIHPQLEFCRAVGVDRNLHSVSVVSE